MMDHSKMVSSAMEHENMDHGDMGMCKMSMTLNAYYENLCVLTPYWRITTIFQLVLSLIVIVIFCAGYEAFKAFSTKFDSKYSDTSNLAAISFKERSDRKSKASLLHAISVAYSFTIMLLFMSFNVWVMGAVVVGAGLGHYFFSVSEESAVSLNCH